MLKKLAWGLRDKKWFYCTYVWMLLETHNKSGGLPLGGVGDGKWNYHHVKLHYTF